MTCANYEREHCYAHKKYSTTQAFGDISVHIQSLPLSGRTYK